MTSRFPLLIFKLVLVNARTFISFQTFMSPDRNVGFTYITGVGCKRQTYKLHRTLDHMRPYL